MAMMSRPLPPKSLFDSLGKMAPAPDMADWIRESFIDPDGPLYSEDHAHVESPKIATLWTTVSNSRKGRSIVGMAEMPSQSVMGGKWLHRGPTPQFQMAIAVFVICFVVLILTSCTAAQQFDNRFHSTGTTPGAAHRDCEPESVSFGKVGRWILEFISYPAPDTCP